MATDPVTAGLGVAGMLLNQDSSRRASNAQQQSNASQDRLIDRQIQWFDMLQRIAEEADKAGAFDPSRQLEQLDRDVTKSRGLEMGNLAGAMRVMGYRPGDSEVGTRLDTIGVKHRDAYTRHANEIRRQSVLDRIAAYSAANPGALNQAVAVYGQRAGVAQAQAAQANPAGFFMSIMPFLNSNSSGAGTASTTATGLNGPFNGNGYGGGSMGGGSIWGQGFGGGSAGGNGFGWGGR